MIKNAKKIEAVMHRHEFFVMRQRLRFQLFCPQCAATVEFFSLDDAVLFSSLAMRETLRLAEAGVLHYLESSGGHLFVCHISLLASDTAKFTE